MPPSLNPSRCTSVTKRRPWGDGPAEKTGDAAAATREAWVSAIIVLMSSSGHQTDLEAGRMVSRSASTKRITHTSAKPSSAISFSAACDVD